MQKVAGRSDPVIGRHWYPNLLLRRSGYNDCSSPDRPNTFEKEFDVSWNKYIHHCPVTWSMVNQDAELIPGHLIAATGDASWFGFSKKTGFTPSNCDGVYPLNQVMRFSTYGQKVPLTSDLESHARFRLELQRSANGIEKGYLHHIVDVYSTVGDKPKVGENEVWMALTRPFGPRDRRNVRELPGIFDCLEEAELPQDAAPLQAIENFAALPEGTTIAGEGVIPFHVDRTDMYQHVYTAEYFDSAKDQLARVAWQEGFDFGKLRFKQVESYFRKPFLLGQVGLAQVTLRLQENVFAARVVISHTDRGEQVSQRPSVVVRFEGTVV